MWASGVDRFGSGCTSTMRASVPAATAAFETGLTRFHMPVPCAGPMIDWRIPQNAIVRNVLPGLGRALLRCDPQSCALGLFGVIEFGW